MGDTSQSAQYTPPIPSTFGLVAHQTVVAAPSSMVLVLL
jgi:hypothetical protein